LQPITKQFFANFLEAIPYHAQNVFLFASSEFFKNIFHHLPLHTTNTQENFCQTGKVTNKDTGKALTNAKN
jgi:hypothetical protein